MFVLGFILDTFEIVFIVIPITAPVLLASSVSIRSGSASRMGVNLQTSFLTPPFGFALFYLRGVAASCCARRTSTAAWSRSWRCRCSAWRLCG